jgi:hypothetical protein
MARDALDPAAVQPPQGAISRVRKKPEIVAKRLCIMASA